MFSTSNTDITFTHRQHIPSGGLEALHTCTHLTCSVRPIEKQVSPGFYIPITLFIVCSRCASAAGIYIYRLQAQHLQIFITTCDHKTTITLRTSHTLSCSLSFSIISLYVAKYSIYHFIYIYIFLYISTTYTLCVCVLYCMLCPSTIQFKVAKKKQ